MICGTLLFVLVSFGSPSPSVAEEPCSHRNLICESWAEAVADQDQAAFVTTAEAHQEVINAALEDAGNREENCPDCEWSLVPDCLAADPSEAAGCLGAVMSCSQPGEIRYRIYMRKAGGPWNVQGTVCRGPTAAVAPDVADVGAAVRAEVAKYLPDSDPTFQPRAGAIVNLPTIFDAGEPATIKTESFDVLGFSVVVTARARWVWTFDNEVVKEFDQPGGTYPDMSVTHTYDQPGTRQVSVTTLWQGQFTLNGEGPFPVPGPEIAKTSRTIDLRVREAHSELVASD